MSESEPKIGSNRGNAGKGRPKGARNKTTALLKDALIQADIEAGGDGGMIGYLKQQAKDNPAPFMALLGKVIPLQVNGPGAGGEHKLMVGWLPSSE